MPAPLALLAALALGLAAPAFAAAPMGEADARTLLTRTGFGATHAEVESFSRLSREAAVDRLLAGARETPVTPPPAWTAEFDSPRGLAREERREWRRRQGRYGQELRAWWLAEMRATPSPLTERMTLFWHSHFATSQRKVRSAVLMYRQNATLRRHALGRFDALLHAIARDPAMLLYLDGHANRAGHPNENFAREVMELFTLGEGHYAQRDVAEAARAFTGLAIDPRTGETRFLARRHDHGEKTVLGHTGALDPTDVIDILLAHPRTAEHLVEKLWRTLVSPAPDADEVARVATRFRESGYDVKVALRALLVSDALYAPESRGTLVKSPVDLVVGTLHTLEIETPDIMPFATIASHLGQTLFAPPNVKGWPGGESWIDADSLLLRKQFLARVVDLAVRPASAAREGRDRLVRGGGRPDSAVASPRSNRRSFAGAPDSAAADPSMLEAGGARHIDRRRARRRADMRARFVDGLARVRPARAAWVLDPDAGPADVERLLLAVAPVEPPPSGARGADLLRALVDDPAFQLR